MSLRFAPSRLAIAVLLLLAFVVRAAYVLHTRTYVPTGDARIYNWLARSLADGRGWAMGDSAYRPPAYPFVLAIIYKLVGAPHVTGGTGPFGLGQWTPARLGEAALSTLTAGLVGLLARRLLGGRAGLVALAISAVYLPLVLVGVSLMSESLLVPLALAATLCALHAREAPRPTRWLVLTGVLAGLAALTRGNGIAIGAALAFVVGFRASRPGLFPGLVVLSAMAVTVMPWTVRNAFAQHAFVPVTTELGATLAGTYNDGAARHDYIWTNGVHNPDFRQIRNDRRLSEAERSAALTSAVASYITAHPASLPLAMFWNTVRLLDLEGRFVSRRSARIDLGAPPGSADLAVDEFWAVGLLACAGLAAKAIRRVPRATWLVPLVLWLTEAPITTGTPRFRAVLDPWFILLAAAALEPVLRESQRAIGALRLRTDICRSEAPVTSSGARDDTYP